MKNMYPKKGRVILHVDMNSFYASVEVAYDPSLSGKPLAIAGNPEERRGIIVTCSYEARALGIKTTMPLWEAKRLCPQLIVMTPNFDRYRKASLAMFDYLRTYTHMVQPVSIDEGYMDITECYELGSPLEIAKRIQTEMMEKLKLPCSIGIAPNKFLAKMASDMKKPLGITVLRKRDVQERLWPLPVSDMHGVGLKSAEKLEPLQIKTIGDLAQANVIQLKAILGINGERLKERANGKDDRPVDPDAIYEFKSIGNSSTLRADTIDEQEIFAVLQRLSDSVSRRLKRKESLARTIQLTIRYHDRKTITRSKKINNPIVESKDILAVINQLWKKHWNEQPVRLLGITTQDLVEKNAAFKQLDLFSYQEDAKKEPLYQTIEKLQSKFGQNVIKKGLPSKAEESNKKGTSFNKDFLQDDR
ncbi:DNA polymerase IV [Bacillus pinisoli]|uniref:DNA polymerase IV n=1 Tax=Bacillus pinisoli TaxID=2901866 RepID=UPI001FF19B7D|nr:DNA polymerase IV [Bacillus pinisoli]